MEGLKQMKKIMKKTYIKLFLLALIVVFSCTGVTYARWTDGLQLMGKIGMGNIEPQLMALEVLPWNTINFYDGTFIEPIVNISTDLANNSAHLSILGAEPGSIYKIFYTVHNYGTIPIVSKISDYSYSGFLIEHEAIRVESNSTAIGEMTITLIDEEDIDFAIPLTFIQAVGI